MLINLIKYEFVKKWQALRHVLLGYILIQTVLLIIARGFLWNSDIAKIFIESDNSFSGGSVPFGLTMILYFVLAIFLGALPFIEGLYRYDKDLSGKQSVLELMIPIISWKKIISKLITAVCSTIIGIGLATLSIVTFILIISNFDQSIVNEILNFMQNIFQSPTRFIVGSLYIIFNLLSIYMIAFCCIAFSKSISHKNKIAVPIGILTFALLVAALGFLNIQVQRMPIVEYNMFGTKDSLSATMMSILVFFTALFGTSWLMENKIEH